MARMPRVISSRAGGESRDEGPDRALLLASVLGRDRAWLLAHEEAALTEEQQRRYDALLGRLARGEPLAYLTGEAWFYGRRFLVDPSVLIPRPETEHLIDEALTHLRGYAKPFVLDVGTGSGAIACTVAAESPNAIVYATDTSEAALNVARRNAALQHLRIDFELADLLPSDAALRFDCVIANLPYIPSADIPQPPDPVSFEPRKALDGGPDGLQEYRRLLKVLPSRLNPGALVLLEAAPPTIGALREMVAEASPSAGTSIGLDYAGLNRYVRVALHREG